MFFFLLLGPVFFKSVLPLKLTNPCWWNEPLHVVTNLLIRVRLFTYLFIWGLFWKWVRFNLLLIVMKPGRAAFRPELDRGNCVCVTIKGNPSLRATQILLFVFAHNLPVTRAKVLCVSVLGDKTTDTKLCESPAGSRRSARPCNALSGTLTITPVYGHTCTSCTSSQLRVDAVHIFTLAAHTLI